MKECKAPGCDKNPYRVGYCSRHSGHLYKYGKIVHTNQDRRPAVVVGDVANIPLGLNAKDGYAIVDKEFAYLARDNWRKTHSGYPIRSIDKAYLHKVVMNVQDSEVDHKDGDKFNNRTSNLRTCTSSQNKWNIGVPSHNTSGYKGVSWDKRRKRFHAYIKFHSKRYHIGYFEDALRAARAYDERAKELHGEFARLNFVQP